VEPDFAINYHGWDRRIAVLDLVSDSGNDRHIPPAKSCSNCFSNCFGAGTKKKWYCIEIILRGEHCRTCGGLEKLDRPSL
jgi:hypothetical protein